MKEYWINVYEVEGSICFSYPFQTREISEVGKSIWFPCKTLYRIHVKLK